MTVEERMRGIDARIFKSAIVCDVMKLGTTEINGAFFREMRQIEMPGGALSGIGLSFDCHYIDRIGRLQLNDPVVIVGHGTFRFLRELAPGGNESGLTTIELGEQL